MPAENTITIKGWRSIKDASVTFGPVNLLIGANAAGKSNFLTAFELLHTCINNNQKLYIDLHGGANTNFYYGTKTTDEITISIRIHEYNYTITLAADNNDSVIIKNEKITNPFTLHDPTNSENERYTPDKKEYQKHTGSISAHKIDAGNALDFIDVSKSNLLSSLITYHFHDTGDKSPMKRRCDIGENAYLFADGANLAAILYDMKKTSPERFEKIKFFIRCICPTFKDFIFRTNKEQLELRWTDINSIDYTFPISSFSDGTLRFIAIATLFLQPKPPKFIIIDEPELGLHPQAVSLLAALIKDASDNSQILISTQSVELINHFTPDEILIAENSRGETKITRPDTQNLQQWLEDYTLGEIWQKNLIGGNP